MSVFAPVLAEPRTRGQASCLRSSLSRLRSVLKNTRRAYSRKRRRKNAKKIGVLIGTQAARLPVRSSEARKRTQRLITVKLIFGVAFTHLFLQSLERAGQASRLRSSHFIFLSHADVANFRCRQLSICQIRRLRPIQFVRRLTSFFDNR